MTVIIFILNALLLLGRNGAKRLERIRPVENVRYILASQSPRRRELLRYITDTFDVIPSDCSEDVPPGIDIYEVPQYLSVQKALCVSRNHPDDLVIGCDTVVIIDGKILGKPADMAQAFSMLRTLSGRTHTVVSGVCVCLKGKTLSFTQKTEVEFYPLSDSEITEYIERFSPLDKAGAYGIQDKAALFVKNIHGDYYNIVGFPIARLKREIDRIIELCGE